MEALGYMLAPIQAVHPPELETDDPTLATVVLPAPPPLSSITQRKDSHLKRPPQVFSYLPASDPGTTYSGLMGGLGLSLVPPAEEEGRLRKRARTDKTNAINNRSQRTSARNLNPNILLSPPDEPTTNSRLQRNASFITVSDDLTPAPSSNGASSSKKGREKGKGKEKSTTKVKEEPQAISLDILETSGVHQLNDDHCSACRSHGGLLYCDGCPKSFHLWCLDPPMDAQEVPEGDNRWFCPACTIRQNPLPPPPRSFLAPLLQQLQTSTPLEFELPEDIRTFFKDVITGPKGSYQDSTETKAARTSRFNILEDREPFRLKDKNGAPILCFQCGKSALPDTDVSAGPSSSAARESDSRTRNSRNMREGAGNTLWKSIASCDYCSLHWHLDCLDPPLSSMPPANKKWMCPTHVEHIVPKQRIPKQIPLVTDIVTRGRPNNGNVDIIPADNGPDRTKKMNIDEVHINGRRYRIPERVIVLDFWDKLGKGKKLQKPPAGLLSGSSSPLTSLSSLDEIEPSVLSSKSSSKTPEEEPRITDSELKHAVELLIGCRRVLVHSKTQDHIDTNRSTIQKAEMGVQTEPDSSVQVDVRVMKQLSNQTSSTLPDADHPKSPTGTTTPGESQAIEPSKPNTSHVPTRRVVRPHTARKSGKVSSVPEAGSGRITRSRVASSVTAPNNSPRPEVSPLASTPARRTVGLNKLSSPTSLQDTESQPGQHRVTRASKNSYAASPLVSSAVASPTPIIPHVSTPPPSHSVKDRKTSPSPPPVAPSTLISSSNTVTNPSLVSPRRNPSRKLPNVPSLPLIPRKRRQSATSSPIHPDKAIFSPSEPPKRSPERPKARPYSPSQFSIVSAKAEPSVPPDLSENGSNSNTTRSPFKIRIPHAINKAVAAATAAAAAASASPTTTPRSTRPTRSTRKPISYDISYESDSSLSSTSFAPRATRGRKSGRSKPANGIVSSG